MYQIWVGGNPGLTRLAETLENKVKWVDMKSYLTTLFAQWKAQRLHDQEAFGDYCNRVGLPTLRASQKEAPKVDPDTVWSI
jgi:sulfite reductase (ferredoxin)